MGPYLNGIQMKVKIRLWTEYCKLFWAEIGIGKYFLNKNSKAFNRFHEFEVSNVQFSPVVSSPVQIVHLISKEHLTSIWSSIYDTEYSGESTYNYIPTFLIYSPSLIKDK